MKPRIGYVNLHVHDVEREVAFFRDVVGLELLYSDEAFHYARFDAGVGFAINSGGQPKAADAAFAERLSGIGFVVEDVDAAYAEMKARGARFTMEPGRQPWGGYMAMFADPEGNLFYLDSAQ